MKLYNLLSAVLLLMTAAFSIGSAQEKSSDFPPKDLTFEFKLTELTLKSDFNKPATI